MPERGLPADVLGMVGIKIVIEQRASAIVRLTLRRLAAKRGDAGGYPLTGHGQQQTLGGTVVLHPHRRKRAEIDVAVGHMFRRKPGAQQIGAGDIVSAVALRHGNHQPGVVVVQYQGELENRLPIYRLRLRRRR